MELICTHRQFNSSLSTTIFRVVWLFFSRYQVVSCFLRLLFLNIQVNISVIILNKKVMVKRMKKNDKLIGIK